LSLQAYNIIGYPLGQWEQTDNEYAQRNKVKTLRWLLFALALIIYAVDLIKQLESVLNIYESYQFNQAALCKVETTTVEN